jgi:hypothetical protein
MQSQSEKQWYSGSSLPFSVKSGALFLLFLLSMLIAACGSSSTTASNDLGNAPVTVTISLGNNNSSPTPPVVPFWCGAWATNTTPSFSSGVVGVYAKFTKTVNLNPVGVGNASATFTVIWPDNSTSTKTVTTTSDGLAVLEIPLTDRANAVGKFTFISVSFHTDKLDCTVPQDRRAFFTLVVVSPTATVTKVASPGTTPTGSSTPAPNPTATCTPRPGGPGPNPTPSPKPGGC